ncbi:T6SS immunity protein Tli3 family protein [Paraburkholderia adhaesiva]|uniref:T6SS immunity protein Tli3 family protein n=1 Tax=Paraburkholderia adhaesiva TaxID=2883244 RepID=UPI001F1DDD9B|nr:hypothetical protein [Paraburkholderia adhaesiva]
MDESLSSSVWWMVPLWSIALLLCVAFWVKRKRLASRWQWMCLVMLSVIAAIPLFPALAAEKVQRPPTQVVYRFDEHRWLELTGWMCEGALTYVDTAQHVRTEVASKFYRIPFFPFIHPSIRYIVIPWSDSLAHLTISRDGGRTFGPDAMISPGYSARIGAIPTVDDVKQFVVLDDRGYIETKDGRLLQSSLPEGDHWGMVYIDSPKPGDVLPNDSEKPPFRDLKDRVPKVEDYTGWTRMQCNPNAGIVPPKNSLSGVPGLIFSAEAYTIGAPIYYGWRAYAHSHGHDIQSGG